VIRTAARCLPILLVSLVGCAALSRMAPCPDAGSPPAVAVPAEGVKPTCAETRLSAQELLDHAVSEVQRGDFERGYRSLALIHIQYPESEQDTEAFPLAARVFRKNYLHHRSEPGSVWISNEPRFMFAWLARFFRADQPFPQREVNAMFLGLHYGMLRDFLAYAKENESDRPELSRWKLPAEEDNGIVESITAVLRDDPSL